MASFVFFVPSQVIYLAFIQTSYPCDYCFPLSISLLTPASHSPLSRLRIVRRTGIGRQLQRFGSILFRHIQLHKLKILRRSELGIPEQILRFLFRFDGIGLGFVGIGSEDGDQVLVFPGLDVVVGGVHAVDVALDGVPFVTDDESIFVILLEREDEVREALGKGILHYGLQVMPYHGADLLRSQLEGAITNEQDRPTVPSLFRSERGALARAHRVAYRAPQNLRQSRDALRKLRLPDAEIRRAGLRDHDVLRLQPLPYSRPQPVMGNHLTLRHFPVCLRDLVRRRRASFYVELAHAIDYFAEHAPHTYPWVFGVAHPDVGAVEVDGRELADSVGEAGGVEVGFYGADCQDEVRGFDAFADAMITAVTFERGVSMVIW